MNPAAELELLSPKPGDVIVVTASRGMTAAQAELIEQHVKERFPGHAVIVVAAGVSLTTEASW